MTSLVTANEISTQSSSTNDNNNSKKLPAPAELKKPLLQYQKKSSLPSFPLYFSNIKKKMTLKILITSDVHTNIEAIVLLTHWMAEKRIVVDFILVPGDIADMKKEDQEIPEKLHSLGMGDASSVLSALEKIKTCVYFIPGNHDPKLTMKKNDKQEHLKLTQHSINLHEDAIEIEDGLVLCGFGGSCNAYNSVTGAIRWHGYPFIKEDESEIRTGINKLIKHVNMKFSKDSQILLMTHVGPQNVKTTIDCSQKHHSLEEPILTGSNAIRSLLLHGTADDDTFDVSNNNNNNNNKTKKENEVVNDNEKMHSSSDDNNKNNKIDTDRIFLNIHGHTHEGAGECKLGNTTIINPGALKEGKFAILTLKREEMDEENGIKKEKWVHANTRYYDLF